MVSDFIQKHATFLRILLIITGITYYLASTLHASEPLPFKMQTITSCVVDIENTGEDFSNLDVYRGGKPRKKPVKVVIDAGHGGKDSGAVGKNSQEKDVTLQLALRMADLMQKSYPEVEVLLTRNTDVFIPLFRRIQYANEQNADVFISIHCNFIENAKTRGTETFVMGLHRAEDNLEVAKRENASILLEQNYEQNYEGYDPNSPEGHIMFSMYQNNYLDKSISLAASIENQFSGLNLSKSRGVKQAGFAVLRRASMPAVLVEAGFLSNEVEEYFLISEEGQQAVTTSLVNAFGQFYKQSLLETVPADIAVNASPKTLQTVPKVNENKSQSESSKPVDAKGNSDSAQLSDEAISPQIPEANGPVFKVQIAAIKQENAEMNTEALREIGTLSTKKQGDVTKYLVGDYITRSSAEIAREKLKNLGYIGAFIVVADVASN
ncbi:MAG: N-acetylmuramoyl-L-alanine amidase [Saprospiraceae bacterium]|nr:N-acetylmuramoyl-L-alanine amidase [Saprospiraceae bacterium]